MRMRRLLAAGVLAGGFVLAVGSPAHAEDPGKKEGKELFECVEKAVEQNKADIQDKKNPDVQPFKQDLEDCRKAKSLITPALPEIIWGSIAFAVVAFMLIKLAFPALRKGLKAREEKIREDLEAAERAKEEARAEKARYDQQLGDARAEAARIIEQARQAAEGVRTDLVARAAAEVAELRARTQEDVRLATERATSDLQQRVGDLSIELAEKIVERNLDRDTQRALVDSYIESVGSRPAT
jgi:F-type H+-transporting ATPase subunit b